MRKTFTWMMCGLGMMVLAGRADAATANFQGNCTNVSGTIYCSFDAQLPASAPSSCPGSSISLYFWDFGDTKSGSSNTLYTTSSYVSHTFAPPHEAAYLVHLSVFCADNVNSAATGRYVCATIGFPGCIFYNSGWN